MKLCLLLLCLSRYWLHQASTELYVSRASVISDKQGVQRVLKTITVCVAHTKLYLISFWREALDSATYFLVRENLHCIYLNRLLLTEIPICTCMFFSPWSSGSKGCRILSTQVFECQISPQTPVCEYLFSQLVALFWEFVEVCGLKTWLPEGRSLGQASVIQQALCPVPKWTVLEDPKCLGQAYQK